tara:strand:+ start:639 stop:938 length:300 start_codon:yes stop_codon:yes gene_type:complete
MSDAKCAKKIMGNKPVSQATPEQLRKIEECGIRAAGGTPNPEVFGESKRKKSKEKSPASMGSPLDMLKPISPFSKSRCWTGYEPVPGKKPYSKGSCRKK